MPQSGETVGSRLGGSRSWRQFSGVRMTNLFEEFILKIMSSQFKRFNLAVGKSSIVWELGGLLDAK